ncbi:MAG: Ig family protein, partial [Acidobacteriaceae bacterium]|nr:Ig family protein [Acidobacteriaceae bacterium]
MNFQRKPSLFSGITLRALWVAASLVLIFGSSARMASAQNCTTVSDNFIGSGALNAANWTTLSPSSGGYGALIQTGSAVQPASQGSQGLAIYTGITFTPDQCAQVTVTSQLQGVTGPAVLMDATGSGYFWFITSPSTVYKISNGAGIGGTPVSCPIPAVGDRIQLSYAAATHTLTCADLTKGTSASAVDYTFDHGSPGVLVDRRNGGAQDSLGSFSAGSGIAASGSNSGSSGSSTGSNSSTPANSSGSSTGSTTVKLTALSIGVPSSLTAGTAGTAYSQTLSASGGTSPYTWAVTSGTLPTGLTLAPSTGIISGIPTTAATSTVMVSVTDSGKPAQVRAANTFIVIAQAPLSIASSALAAGTTGVAYAQALVAAGGTPSYTWSIKGSLPAGLTLAATTGVISGTPTTTGTFSVTVRVADNSNPSQAQTASTSITIAAAAATTPTGPGTTWYVRGDGGTRYSANTTTGQCDGKADAAYGGVGTNQHCAFNDYRFLYDDQSYGNRAWVIAGGDTVILRGGPWRVGF